MTARFLPSGDCGLTVEFGTEIDRGLNRQIMTLRAAVEHAGLAGIVEMVPSYRSLLIHYDPLTVSQENLVEAIRPLLAHMEEEGEVEATHWRLPICFDDDFAPDLVSVAEWAGMDRQAVMDVLVGIRHYVYMLGFAPGLPYMGDLPEGLAIPRRDRPIPRAEKGSVLVATGLTIIYPVANPTGWHVVGRIPVPIFDIAAEEPVLLSPGDSVSFHPVERAEFSDLEAQVAAGAYRFEKERC